MFFFFFVFLLPPLLLCFFFLASFAGSLVVVVVVAYLVEIDVHAFELGIRSAVIGTTAVKAMLGRNGLPKGTADLIALEGARMR